MTRENAILDKAKRMYEQIDDESYVMKTDGNGEPDLVGCITGRTVVIECKQSGRKPTPLQYAKLKRWAKSGAVALWTNGKVVFAIDVDGTESVLGEMPVRRAEKPLQATKRVLRGLDS